MSPNDVDGVPTTTTTIQEGWERCGATSKREAEMPLPAASGTG